MGQILYLKFISQKMVGIIRAREGSDRELLRRKARSQVRCGRVLSRHSALMQSSRVAEKTLCASLSKLTAGALYRPTVPTSFSRERLPAPVEMKR